MKKWKAWVLIVFKIINTRLQKQIFIYFFATAYFKACKSLKKSYEWAITDSIQDYLYSAFYDTIVAKQLLRKLSF